VLPPSKSFTQLDVPEEAQPVANDFEALEKLRRLAFTDRVDEPTQLEMFRQETTA
jgi:putative DNA methylase